MFGDGRRLRDSTIGGWFDCSIGLGWERLGQQRLGQQRFSWWSDWEQRLSQRSDWKQRVWQ